MGPTGVGLPPPGPRLPPWPPKPTLAGPSSTKSRPPLDAKPPRVVIGVVLMATAASAMGFCTRRSVYVDRRQLSPARARVVPVGLAEASLERSRVVPALALPLARAPPPPPLVALVGTVGTAKRASDDASPILAIGLPVTLVTVPPWLGEATLRAGTRRAGSASGGGIMVPLAP
jgi:hypothetical protein